MVIRRGETRPITANRRHLKTDTAKIKSPGPGLRRATNHMPIPTVHDWGTPSRHKDVTQPPARAARSRPDPCSRNVRVALAGWCRTDRSPRGRLPSGCLQQRRRGCCADQARRQVGRDQPDARCKVLRHSGEKPRSMRLSGSDGMFERRGRLGGQPGRIAYHQLRLAFGKRSARRTSTCAA